MRRLFALLALVCLVAVPLAAVADAPAASTEEAPAVQQAPETEAPSADATETVLEDLLDDGRQEMSCVPSQCDDYCKRHYGPWSFGVCLGGTCTCSV